MAPSQVSPSSIADAEPRARFTVWVDRLGRGTHFREYLRIHEEALAVTRGVEMERSGPAFERNATRKWKAGAAPTIRQSSIFLPQG